MKLTKNYIVGLFVAALCGLSYVAFQAPQLVRAVTLEISAPGLTSPVDDGGATDNAPIIEAWAKAGKRLPAGRFYCASTINLPRGYHLIGRGKAEFEHGDTFYTTEKNTTAIIWNGTNDDTQVLVCVEGSNVLIQDVTLQGYPLLDQDGGGPQTWDDPLPARGEITLCELRDGSETLAQTQVNLERVSMFHAKQGIYIPDVENGNTDQCTYQNVIFHRVTYPFTCDQNQALEHWFINCTAKDIGSSGTLMRWQKGGRSHGDWMVQDDAASLVDLSVAASDYATSNAGWLEYKFLFDAQSDITNVVRDLDDNTDGDWRVYLTGYLPEEGTVGAPVTVDRPAGDESVIEVDFDGHSGGYHYPP